MSSQVPLMESDLAHCHTPTPGRTLSSSVRIAVSSVPTWGCLGEITTLPILVDILYDDRQVDIFQVIPVIVIGLGCMPSSPPAPIRTVIL